jgi:hypothetical protein
MANEADRRALMDAVVPGSYEAQQRKEAEAAAANASTLLSQDAAMDKFRLQPPNAEYDHNTQVLRDAATTGNLKLKQDGNTEVGIAFGHRQFDTDGDYSEAAPHRIPHKHGKTAGVYVNWKF